MSDHIHDPRGASPVEAVYAALRKINPKWDVEIGARGSDEWIAGTEFVTPERVGGPFDTLLQRIGERLRTTDRKVVAAAFALRFGWSAAAAIAPYVTHACVPDLALNNVSLRFSKETFFERVAVHRPRGTMLRAKAAASHPTIELAETRDELLGSLRSTLVAQAKPMVDALYRWSRFPARAIWGQITSSWGTQFINVTRETGDPSSAIEHLGAFFASAGEAFEMRPEFYPVSHGDRTRIFHRRASCCLYYKASPGHYCASCPLISKAESVSRNLEWMKNDAAIP